MATLLSLVNLPSMPRRSPAALTASSPPLGLPHFPQVLPRDLPCQQKGVSSPCLPHTATRDLRRSGWEDEVAEQPACEAREHDRSGPEVDRPGNTLGHSQTEEITEIEDGRDDKREEPPGGRAPCHWTEPSTQEVGQEPASARGYHQSHRIGAVKSEETHRRGVQRDHQRESPRRERTEPNDKQDRPYEHHGLEQDARDAKPLGAA